MVVTEKEIKVMVRTLSLDGCVQSAKKQAEAVLVGTFTSLNNTHEKITRF